jgi:hypothetical protein
MIENKITSPFDDDSVQSNAGAPLPSMLEIKGPAVHFGDATSGSRYPLHAHILTDRSNSARTGICGNSTLITPYGVEKVSGLTVGDRVLTVEMGFLTIQKIHKDAVPGNYGKKPIYSTEATSDDNTFIYLAPYQLVKLTNTQNNENSGPLIQARYLIGISGFRESDIREEVFFTLEFDQPATIWLNSKYVQGVHFAASAEHQRIENGEWLDHSQSIKWRQSLLATVVGRAPVDLF